MTGSGESIRRDDAVRESGAPGERRLRLARTTVALLLALHVGLAWAARSPGVATGQDDVEYITLSQSIRQGGYSDLMRVDEPVHAQYPPGYPALLAAWSTLAGDTYDRLLLVSLVCSVATLLLLFHALRKRFGDATALAAVAILAVNPHWNAIAGSIRSELPYTMLVIGSLVLAAGDTNTPTRRAGAIALAVGAALTRSAGITLLAALLLYWLLKRDWKTVGALALASALTVGPWMAWTALAPEQRVGSSYVAEIRAIDDDTPWTDPLPQRVLEHTRWYTTVGLPHNLAVPAVPGTPIDNAIASIILLATSLVGLAMIFARWRPAALYVIAYAGLLAIWIWSAERFVIPLLPLLVPAILLGAWRIGRVGRTRAGAVAATLVAGVLLVFGSAGSIAQARDQAACRTSPGLPPGCLQPEQIRFFEALDWIEASLPDDAVVLTAKNGAMYWYTGRRTISYAGSLAQDSASFLPWIRDQGADWILLSRLEVAEGRLARLIAMNCHSLDVTARFSNDAIIFGFPAPDESTPTEACAAIDAYGDAAS